MPTPAKGASKYPHLGGAFEIVDIVERLGDVRPDNDHTVVHQKFSAPEAFESKGFLFAAEWCAMHAAHDVEQFGNHFFTPPPHSKR